MKKLAIIGAGPAALSAAIYASRAGLEVEIYEKSIIGGALNQISEIYNYPGFIGSGIDLAKNMKDQAKNLGAKIKYEEITSLENIEADAILVATGSEPKRLNIITKTPISYCALCDGELYKDKNVAMVGGGNSAASEAIYLSGIASNVDLFTHSELKSSKHLEEKLKERKNIKIHENTETKDIDLDSYDGIFVCVGKSPATSFLNKDLLDENGFVKTLNGHQTSSQNIFAAGDVRSGSVKQAITATADGAEAAIEIAEYLKNN